MDTEATAALAAIEAWQTNDKFGRDTSARVHTCKQEAVIAYGEAIIAGRGKNPGDQAFGDWIKKNKLDQTPFQDFRERSGAMTIAKLARGIGTGTDSAPFADCQYNTPSNMVKWARGQGLKLPVAKLVVVTPFDGDNLDAVVSEFAKGLGIDPNGASWVRRKREIETLFTRGTEHLRAMVGVRGRGCVGLESAVRYALDHSAEEQDKATHDDVRGYRQVARGTGRKEGAAPDKPKKPSLDDWRRNQNQMAIDAALRRAGKPPITPEEFERPPPELRHQQYPGREPGVTYGNVHREEHGHTWHNVSQRKREMLERKLKELAGEVEKAFVDFATLEPDQQYSVRKRWRIALNRLRPTVDLSEKATAEELAEAAGEEAAA